MRDSGCSMRVAVTMTRSRSSEPEASAKPHAGASRHDRTNRNEDDEVDDRTDMTRKLRKNCQPFHPQVSQFGRGEPEGPVAARELPLAQHTPADRWTTAASRSPGSWLGVRRVTFPDRQLPADPVVSTRGAPLTVAGAARASTPLPICIPLLKSSGELVARGENEPKDFCRQEASAGHSQQPHVTTNLGNLL